MLGIAGVVIFLVIWEIVSRFGPVDMKYLPPPTEVVPTFFRNIVLIGFWSAVGNTLLSWFLGMLLAVLGGGVLGILIGLSSFARRATRSTIEFLRPIPSVALIPLAVLLFSTPIQQSLLVVTYGAFWQVLFQTLYGVADVDAVAMATGRSYGFSWLQRVRHIVMPTMLPYLMTGVRLASAVALILAITCELQIGKPVGLGAEILHAKDNGLYASSYALVLATGLLGIVLNFGMRWIERRLLSWHQSVRSEAAA
ncbi:ABC transporter permease [Microbacterium protaetiae]|uniref:ABC transporter permease n=2 Tax=Microbacterium protaetiae TaxID=2509458 RepID=A0A4P6EUH5_9MICO|nr:ABC transporter permease [Microbacterium protaetiae]